MITVKTGDCMAATQFVPMIIDNDNIDGTVRYLGMKILKACHPEAENFLKQRDELIEEYKGEDGQIDPAKLGEALQPYADVECELLVKKLHLSKLVDHVKGSILLALDPFIEDDMDGSA